MWKVVADVAMLSIYLRLLLDDDIAYIVCFIRILLLLYFISIEIFPLFVLLSEMLSALQGHANGSISMS